MVSKSTKVSIYFIVDITGIKFANGGYVNLTAWYWLLRTQGHKVRFLDIEMKGSEAHRLSDICPSSKYLCEDIFICGPNAFDEDKGRRLLWAAWMSDPLSEFIEEHGWRGALLFVDLGQLLRPAHMSKIEAVRRLSPFPPMINNQFLRPLYVEADMPDAIPLDTFNRSDLFYSDWQARKPGLIGYQPEGHRSTGEERYSRGITQIVKHGVEDLLLCIGTHREVSEKMRQCDIFLWFNIVGINHRLLEGECIGRSLIEALSSGCVVIAKMNYFTLRMMPKECLVCTPEEGLRLMDRLLKNPRKKEQLRRLCMERGRDYQFAGFGGERQKVLDWVFSQVERMQG